MGFKPKLKPSSWDPRFEESLLQKWEKEDIYRFNKRSKLPKFVILIHPVSLGISGLPHSTAR
jgi:valyl-tRNA synthetase